MKREHTNRVRFILEDCLPPVIRDMPLLNRFFSKLSGIDLQECRRLREKIPTLTAEDLTDFYRKFPRIQDQTDNSRRCIEEILSHICGRSVCDIGCGTGYLLSRMIGLRAIETLVGVDFSQHEEWTSLAGITFIKHDILHLPFGDGQFDTVVSTHTLEHVLDIPSVVKELRRICRQRLILVVPRERESIYSLNPHFHYFPYEHSFLKFLLPLPSQWQIKRLGRDYLYTETYSR
jgi:ubiquinone/menaquinone biosynthesis C-methylase UbiE